MSADGDRQVPVLVVEDDRVIGEQLRLALTGSGYTVTVATTGAAARAASRERVPRLVLLDLGLPDTDGFALCQSMRAELSDAVMVVLTARHEDGAGGHRRRGPARVHHLRAALAREAPPLLPNGPVGELLHQAADRWQGVAGTAARTVTLEADADTADGVVPSLPTSTVLDVLLENAISHGLGTVRISARRIGSLIVISVADEGRFEHDVEQATTPGGIGLPLAHRAARDAGGQLVDRSAGTRLASHC